LALDQHKVHRSLLRPPLFLGVERELFFPAAGCAVPIIGYGSLSLKSLLLLGIYSVLAYWICTRLTAKDHHLLSLFLANLRYRDHYEPLPSPDVVGRRPPARKG
jgi:type IV secretory pathway TrbD component